MVIIKILLDLITENYTGKWEKRKYHPYPTFSSIYICVGVL